MPSLLRGCLFVVALAASLGAEPSRAGSEFTAEFWPGYTFHFGRWNTVWVEVKAGTQRCRGTLSFDGEWGGSSFAFQREVDLVASAHVRLPLYVMPRGNVPHLSFHPADTRSQAVSIDLPHIKSIQEHTYTVCVLGYAPFPSSDDLQKLLEQVSRKMEVGTEGSAGRASRSGDPAGNNSGSTSSIDARPERQAWPPRDSIEVVHASPDLLPDDSRGYDPINMLVWSDPDFAALTPAREAALRDWVYEGGELVLVPGQNWQQFKDTGLASMLPARPVERLRRTAWSDLGTLIPGASAPEEGGSFWRLRPSGNLGDLWWRTGRAGFGRVTVLAFDPGEPVFRDWAKRHDGLTALWARALGLETAFREYLVDLKAIRQGDTSLFWNGLQQFTGVRVIPFGWILAFLVAYILVIGPVDYLVLKRLGRQEWTWVTFPAVVILVLFITVWWATTAKGVNFVGNSATIVDLVPGVDRVRVQEWSSVFTPTATRLRVRASKPGGWVRHCPALGGQYRGSAVSIDEETGCRAELPSLQWGVTSFCAVEDRSGFGSIRIRRHSGISTMTIENRTPQSFTAVSVLFPNGRVQGLGPLRAMEARNVESSPVSGQAWIDTQPMSLGGPEWERLHDYRWGNHLLGSLPSFIAYTSLHGYIQRIPDDILAANAKVSRYVADTRWGQGVQQVTAAPSILFHVPGRVDPEAIVFVGWTTDVPPIATIERVSMSRRSCCLVRTVLVPEGPHD